MEISELLIFMHKQGGSDLHISSGVPPMIRVHGDIKKLNVPALTQEQCHDMIYDIMNDVQQKTFENEMDIDFAISLGEIARFRVNAFLQHRGPSAVFRIIPAKILTFKQLGLTSVFADICKYEKGVVLVTGPTGSGKSTTLAAMVDYINDTQRGHILTLEDPIEFVHQTKNCLINQREVGPHTKSFSRALKGALRQDPDIILVGEMRDLETIQLALSAAETGHLVFGTLHTSSAPKTIDRIIDVFPSEEQEKVRTMLAESLKAVIAQNLLKKIGGGRVAAHEIMIGIPAIKNLIREAKIHQIPSMIQTGTKYGMQLLDQHLKDLLMKGIVAKEEVMMKCINPKFFDGVEGPRKKRPERRRR
ncbi:MAG: twitching motility protein PilT [Candidatus Cloacimonetes bacterium 4572_55]|nr:MAG: twitching motility protein PilT [Candidatus Cloacimonetes bacterium 4572_55]